MIKCTEECKNGCHFYVHEKCYKTCPVIKKQLEEMARENKIMKEKLTIIKKQGNYLAKRALYELYEKAK